MRVKLSPAPYLFTRRFADAFPSQQHSLEANIHARAHPKDVDPALRSVVTSSETRKYPKHMVGGPTSSGQKPRATSTRYGHLFLLPSTEDFLWLAHYLQRLDYLFNEYISASSPATRHITTPLHTSLHTGFLRHAFSLLNLDRDCTSYRGNRSTIVNRLSGDWRGRASRYITEECGFGRCYGEESSAGQSRNAGTSPGGQC